MLRHRVIPLAVAFACVSSPAVPISTRSHEAITWQLVWSDEFDGPAGAPVDKTKWSYDLGDGCPALCGWGNNEKQSYAEPNATLNGAGQLAIVARTTAVSGRYTSGKITTRGIMNAQPGRVEARLKLPAGQGLWPAFWMLGHDHPNTPWPQCGELDIMENKGSNPLATSSAIHGLGYAGAASFNAGTTFTSNDYHVYAVEWDSTGAAFSVDGNLHLRVTRSQLETKGPSILDQSFYLILNLAVGGFFDGDPASDSIFPATMLVDYVRVYRAQ